MSADRFTKAIESYEIARKELADNQAHYNMLKHDCRGVTTELIDDYDISEDIINQGTCVTACYEIVNKMDMGPSDYLQYDEVLISYGCSSCNKARGYRRGDLAKAKKEFGIEKRRISALGKSLIKNN